MIKGSFKRTALESLAEHLDVRGPDDCWPWTGFILPNGYGRLYGNGKKQYIHVVAYYGESRDSTPGMDIDHLCHDPQTCVATDRECLHRRCGNPRHLTETTHRANSLRGNSPAARNAVKTRCLRGHAYHAANTYWLNGKRRCKACHRDEVRAKYVPVVNRRPYPSGRTKTHCPRGHSYAEHLATWPNGRKYCRPCRADYQVARKAELQARSRP